MTLTLSTKGVILLGTVFCASAALAACTTEVVPGSGSGIIVSSASAALAAPPTIQLDNPNDPERWKDTLQFGNNNDAYWFPGDNAWGAGDLTEGPAPDQYEQYLGVSPTVGPNGEVAFRLKWRWPQGSTDVKAFPAVLSGRKPGFYSSDSWFNGHPIRFLDGTFSQRAPTGDTPGTFMSQQLPIPALTAKFARSDVASPTGQGQLTFDIWLQSQPGQDHGFVNSSITHEIMIPLGNWGNYGAYPDGRPPWWYDHDATIGGKLYHVYATKGTDGVLRYDFGFLAGNYGRSGWKMIAFVPDVTPVPPGEIDLAAFINYLQTRTDSAGTAWAQGDEYLASVELGVEPVVGSGDIVVYDYKVSPTSPTSTLPMRIQAEDGAISGSGVSVKTEYPGYEGSGAVGFFSDAGDRVTVSFPNVAAGWYDLNIRYYAGGLQLNDVVINGTTWSKTFPATGTEWGSWGITTISGVALPAGTNTVSIIKDWGFFKVDYIEIAPASGGSGGTSTATKIQAENGSLNGVGIETYYADFEGNGAVGPFANEGDRATVSFTNVVARTYDVRIRYRAGSQQQNTVAINGIPRSEPFTATGSGWAFQTISGVALTAGTNTVAIIKDWGWIDVDYIEIVPSTPSPPPPSSGLQIGVNVHTGGGSTTGNDQVASVMANRNLRVARLDYFVNSDQTLVRDQIVKINANGGSAQLVVENSYQWDGSCNSNLAAVEQDSYSQASQMVGAMKDIAHDFEVLNEVQLYPWINNEVPWNSAGTSTAPYAGKPCVASVTAAIRGATRAIHDHGQRATVGVIGRDFGWLSWLNQNNVAWDVTGYHIYPHYGDPSLASDPWFGTNGPLYQLSLFGKPITINEFNCGEIYDSNYENTAGQPDTETCLRSVNKHLQEIRSYSGGQPIGSVVTYELFDEPSKAAPENHFGLMYALSNPKIELYLVTAFAGGILTSTEQATITSRGLLTDAQIAGMK